MSVRMKILGGFFILFFIGLGLGITGLVSTNSLGDLSDAQYELQNVSAGVSDVLNAHYIWRQGLTEAVLNISSFSGSLDPNTCALGKWKNSDDAKKVSDSEILSLLKKLDSPHDYIHTEAKRIVELIGEGNQPEAVQVLNGEILPYTVEAISILEAMTQRYETMLDDNGNQIIKLKNTVNTVIIILICVAFAASALLVWLVTSSIMKPIRKIAAAAELISTGDLDVQTDYNVNDEIGTLSTAFQHIIDTTKQQVKAAETLAEGDLTVSIVPRSDKDTMNIALQKMVSNLNNMFREINSATTQVSTGSKQIADGAQSLAEGATEQASAVEQLSSSITSVAEKTKVNSDMAVKAAKLAETIKSNAEKGSSQMDEMMSAVREINQASQDINKVIKVIDDIAFQTNILALNAAVEAARAGQHGKGFAVVAEEVRSLAAKSADAAKDTGSLIANSIEKAELGAHIADETAASLVEIVSGINESAELVSAIASSSEEQSTGISLINKGIEQVANVIQQNSAAAEESAAASEEMNGQSDILQGLVAQFKLKDNPPSLGSASYGTARRAIPQNVDSSSNTAQNGNFGKY